VDEAHALLGALARELPRALLFLKSVRRAAACFGRLVACGRRARERAFKARPLLPGPRSLPNASASHTPNLPARSVELSIILPEDQEAALAAGAPEPTPRLVLRATAEAPQSLQEPIVRFVAGGGGGTGAQQLASFFQRLAATPSDKLPAAAGRVRLVRIWGDRELRARVLAAAAASEAGGGQQQPGVAEDGPPGDEAEDFLVLNALGGGAARDAALAAWKESSRKFLPWVGVAAPLGGAASGDGGDGAEQHGAGGGAPAALNPVGSAAGRAFCFLPLPVSTGLPVAVNGYFELSSNRRDVWHGGDMAGAGAARARWNEALLADAVAPAYLQLLLSAARELGPRPAFWALWPGAGSGREPWAVVPRALYRLLAQQLVLWCPSPGGLAKGSWLAPNAALLPDAAVLADPRLRDLLLACGVPLALGLAEEPCACLLKWTPGAKQVGTGDSVRACVKGFSPASTNQDLVQLVKRHITSWAALPNQSRSRRRPCAPACVRSRTRRPPRWQLRTRPRALLRTEARRTPSPEGITQPWMGHPLQRCRPPRWFSPTACQIWAFRGATTPSQEPLRSRRPLTRAPSRGSSLACGCCRWRTAACRASSPEEPPPAGGPRRRTPFLCQRTTRRGPCWRPSPACSSLPASAAP
jgi:hypothetical protein